MENIVSTQEIQETQAYQKLEKCFQNMVLSYNNKKAISYGLNVHKSTGVIPGSVGGNNLKVLKDIIEKNQNLIS